MARGLPVGEDLKEGNSLRIRCGSGEAEYRTVFLVSYFFGNLITHGACDLEPRMKLIDVHTIRVVVAPEVKGGCQGLK